MNDFEALSLGKIPTAQNVTAKTKIPTMSLIACGGCGINLVSKIVQKELKPNLIERISISAVDTSEANMTDLLPGIKSYTLAEEGSGKVRSTHIQKIQQKLDSAGIVLSDINVVVFSMSGGSGSVLGPLISRMAALERKTVVLIAVVDDQSRQDCLNTISTLRTMQTYTKEDNLYFPVMMYSNIDTGRFVVNNTIATRVNTLIEMFISKSVEEIDLTDKLNFLQPHKINCGNPGVYSLHVTDSISESEEILGGEMAIDISDGLSAHGSITIDNIGKTVHKFSNVAFLGYSETEKFYGIIGRPLDQGVLDQLRKTADRHAHSTGVAQSDLMGEFESVDKDKKRSLIID